MNRRFEFRLARILRIRGIEERAARATWAEAELRSAQADGESERARRAVARGRRDLAAELGPPALPDPDAPSLARGPEARSGTESGKTLDASRALRGHAALDSLLRFFRSRLETGLTRRAQADDRKERWRARDSDRRALEELRERAARRHREELRRREEAQADEEASVRDALRRREETRRKFSGLDAAADE